jgi:hypothetical protein
MPSDGGHAMVNKRGNSSTWPRRVTINRLGTTPTFARTNRSSPDRRASCASCHTPEYGASCACCRRGILTSPNRTLSTIVSKPGAPWFDEDIRSTYFWPSFFAFRPASPAKARRRHVEALGPALLGPLDLGRAADRGELPHQAGHACGRRASGWKYEAYATGGGVRR